VFRQWLDLVKSRVFSNLLLTVLGVLLAVWVALTLVGCPKEPVKPVVVTPPPTPNSATVTHITNPTTEQWAALMAQVGNAQLLAEVKQLKSTVQSMTQALATLQVQGGGQFVPVPGPQGPQGPQGLPGSPQVSPVVPVPTIYKFTDWRLAFTGDIATQTAEYTLTQRFEVNHMVGRQANGTPTSLFTMFELGPGATKTKVPAVITTTVVDEVKARWRLSPTVQVGWGIGAAAEVPATYAQGVLGSVQLWKRGVTAAAEDSTLALMAPAVMVSAGKAVTVGVIPVGLNLGARIPHQPFKDIWANPFVGWDVKAGKVKVGFGISASF
jgi:hypothetical protein